MIDINFKGKKIFEFKDTNFIQIVGHNEELKRLIIDIYLKIFNGYKFSDTDIEAMNGYYPEIIKEEYTFKKGDITVIKISNRDDIINQLQVKNKSILFKYLISLEENVSISRTLYKVEESLAELSIKLDKLIEYKFSSKDASITSGICDVALKNIIKSFIDIDFIDQHNQVKPLWLLTDNELISLLLNVIELIIKENNKVTLIIDGLDIEIMLETYNYFINKLYNLSKKHSNFKIWLIPKSEKGVKIDYSIFENTYVLNNSIISIGSFDTTYESICRNYPNNNLPTKSEVLKSLLRLFPFHYDEKFYNLSKETVILQVFLKLLNERPIRLENAELSNLETKFLTNRII